MPPDDALRCLWIKLGDRLVLRGFVSARAPDAGHDVDLADRLASVDVWVRGPGGWDVEWGPAWNPLWDQVWLWGTGLVELSVTGYRCQIAYAAHRQPDHTYASSTAIIADLVGEFVDRCDRTG